MNNNMTTIATEIVTKVTDEYGFRLPSAQLYGVTDSGDTVFLAEHPDVYDLLYPESVMNAGGSFTKLAVATSGWAAPLNEDGEVTGAPSQHSERRRVCLVTVVSKETLVSALRFEDDPDGIMTDEDEATGTLAEALHRLMEMMK